MSAAAALLAPSNLDKLSYAALKKACSDRGIDTSGNKQKLVHLLRAQLKASVPSAPGTRSAVVFSGSTWGGLNQDVWKQILQSVTPLPNLYRLRRISKAFKSLIEEILQQRKGGRTDYATLRPWKTIRVKSGGTPKVQATIKAVHMSFDPTNRWAINIAWLHDWGTLFEDWTNQVDLRTGQDIPSKYGLKTEKNRSITDVNGYRFYVDKDLTTVKVVGKNFDRSLAFDNEIVCIDAHPYGILAMLLEDWNGFYIFLC